MGDLSPNFSRWEFECGCGCGFDTVDYELITVLEDLRSVFNQPITITSGCRCRRYNFSSKVGGSPYSLHMEGKAADIIVSNVLNELVRQELTKNYPRKYGIGRYKSFVHIDVRSAYARWSG